MSLLMMSKYTAHANHLMQPYYWQECQCITSINDWLKSNGLKLNAEKTNFMWCATRQRLTDECKNPVVIGDHRFQPVSKLRCLGVIIDSTLSFSSHVSKVISVCFGALRQLRSIRRSITVSLASSLVNALVFSRLEYCISVLAGITDEQVKRLQSVIHASVRLVFNLPRSAHISSAIRRLQWLAVKSRIDLRLVTLAFNYVYQWLSSTLPV